MTVYSLVTKRGCGSHQRVRWSADQQGLVIASLQYGGARWWGAPADPQWLWQLGILGAAGSGSLGVGVLGQAGLWRCVHGGRAVFLRVLTGLSLLALWSVLWVSQVQGWGWH